LCSSGRMEEAHSECSIRRNKARRSSLGVGVISGWRLIKTLRFARSRVRRSVFFGVSLQDKGGRVEGRPRPNWTGGRSTSSARFSSGFPVRLFGGRHWNWRLARNLRQLPDSCKDRGPFFCTGLLAASAKPAKHLGKQSAQPLPTGFVLGIGGIHNLQLTEPSAWSGAHVNSRSARSPLQ